MNHRKLAQYFETRRRKQMPMVLATVFTTEGSTYSKPGSHMLIDEHGIYQGMLSGGCLEGDLAIRASVVLESACPQVVSYDLAADDELWGLGVGCDGMMRVFLQPLVHGNDYAPFPGMLALTFGREAAVLATVITSSDDDVAAGATVLVSKQSATRTGMTKDALDILRAPAQHIFETGRNELRTCATTGGELEVFFCIMQPVPRVLLLGAGLDAVPLLTFVSELGWMCTVVDHRPAYLERAEFDAAEETRCVAVNELATSLNLEAFDLAVIMSHHLVSDRGYLEQVARSAIPYIGLLGPAGRKQRLLAELGKASELLEGRLHGPAGLNLGGRGAAAIALSIVAEMQRYIAQREGSISR